MARNAALVTLSGSLTAAQLDAADKARPPAGKTLNLRDGAGLFARVQAAGSIGWRLRYWHSGKERLMSFGTWPAVSVERARELAAAERAKIERGADPAHERAAVKVAANAASAATFGVIGEEVLSLSQSNVSAKTASKHRWLFGLLKKLHQRPVGEVTTGEILGILEGLQRARLGETAARTANFAESVFRRAIATDRCKVNPALSSHFRGQLITPKPNNRPALTDRAKVGQLMQWLGEPARTAAKSNYPSVSNALLLVAHTWLRSDELRGGRWEELRDLDGSKPEWIVPAGRMKMDRPHVVPLSRQAAEIIKAQREVVDALGGSPLMFPGARGLSSRPITGDALMHSLHMLWKGEHSVHGFRSTASTLLNEMGVDSALIELQLAHKGTDKIQKIYDRSQRLDARREMMQTYSDLLDTLRSEAKGTS